MLWVCFCLFVGMLFGNFVEWFAHKFILHGWGKKKNSPFCFHWRTHHKNSRKNGFVDTDYNESILSWNSRGKEVLGLISMGALFFPVYFLLPWTYAGMLLWILVYYVVHSYSHSNPDWAKKYLRWHYDHHLGLDQDANWNVVLPLWDYLLGTRVRYEYTATGKVKKGSSEHKEGKDTLV